MLFIILYFSNIKLEIVKLMVIQLTSSLLFKILNLVTFFVIFYFSVINLNDTLPLEENLINDKLLHLIAYFSLSLTTILAQWKFSRIKESSTFYFKNNYMNDYLLIFLLTFFYGIILELIQNFLPSRNLDINDIIANGIGIVIGLLVFFVIKFLIDERNIRIQES